MPVRTVVMPVAGLGTRSLPATKVIPKEMLVVVDKPLIQYAVEEAMAAGCQRVVFVTSRGKSAITDHFDHHFELEAHLASRGKTQLLELIPSLERMGITVASVRQPLPLGLGHAIWCARHVVGNETFAVMLPDDLIRHTKPALQQMVESYREQPEPMVAMMAVPPDQTHKYGIGAPVQPGDVQHTRVPLRDVVEKPPPGQAPSNLALIGRYILPPEIFSLLENQETGAGGEIQLTDALLTLLKKRSLCGFRFAGVRYDCGDKAGLVMAQAALAMERPELRQRLLPFFVQQLDYWRQKDPDQP